MRKYLNFLAFRKIDIVNILAFGLFSVLLMWPINPYKTWANEIQYGDASILSYLLSWGSHSLFTNPMHYFDVPLAYPRTQVLAGMDGMIFQAILVSPVWWITHNPILVYNCALWLSFWFCLACGYIASLCLIKSRLIAIIVAVLFTVTTDRYFHANGHINLLFTGFLPLVFAFTHRSLIEQRKLWLILAGISFGVSVYASNYLFVLSSITFVCAVICSTIAYRGQLTNKLRVIKIPLLAVLIAWPIPLIHWSASRGTPTYRTSLNTAIDNEATLPGWTRPPSYPISVYSRDAKVMGLLETRNARGEDCQFLGFLVGFCLILETLRLISRFVQRSWSRQDTYTTSILLVGILLVLASLGPYLTIFGTKIPGPYMLLHKSLLQFTGFYRVPSRLAFITEWLFALVIGFSIWSFLHKSKIHRSIAVTVIIAITLFEHLSIGAGIRYSLGSPDLVKTLNEIDPDGSDPAVIIPDPQSLGVVGLLSTSNWRPLVNAWPDNPLLTEYKEFFNTTKMLSSSQSQQLLYDRGVKWVLTMTKEASDQAEKTPYLVQKFRIPHQGLYEVTEQSSR